MKASVARASCVTLALVRQERRGVSQASDEWRARDPTRPRLTVIGYLLSGGPWSVVSSRWSRKFTGYDILRERVLPK
jgi:hypothetical protein